jgi:hypothetical protein
LHGVLNCTAALRNFTLKGMGLASLVSEYIDPFADSDPIW